MDVTLFDDQRSHHPAMALYLTSEQVGAGRRLHEKRDGAAGINTNAVRRQRARLIGVIENPSLTTGKERALKFMRLAAFIDDTEAERLLSRKLNLRRIEPKILRGNPDLLHARVARDHTGEREADESGSS